MDPLLAMGIAACGLWAFVLCVVWTNQREHEKG